MEAIYTEFGRLLRQTRRHANLTQEALAKRVGLSRTSITNIERGNQHVGLHLLYELAKALEVSHQDLLPAEQANQEAASSLEEMLQGLGRRHRETVEGQLRLLSPKDRDRVVRLVRGEARKSGKT